MTASRLLWPLARAYARHIASPVTDAELRRRLAERLSFFPLWARSYLVLSGLFVRWLGPRLTLRRWTPFERLSDQDKEDCLSRLQRDGRILVRPLFLGIKSLLLACTYGSPEFLAAIGYKPGVRPRG